MTEIESQIIEELRKLEVHIATELGEIKGEIKSNGERASAEHENLKALVEQNIRTDEKRLDNHAADIDNLRDRIIKLEEFQKNQKEKETATERKITNRIAFFAGAAAILAVILAYVLDKL